MINDDASQGTSQAPQIIPPRQHATSLLVNSGDLLPATWRIRSPTHAVPVDIQVIYVICICTWYMCIGMVKKYLEAELFLFLPWFPGDVGVFSFSVCFVDWPYHSVVGLPGCLEFQDTISYNASISACRYHWRLAIHLMKRQSGGPRRIVVSDQFGSIAAWHPLVEEVVSKQLCACHLNTHYTWNGDYNADALDGTCEFWKHPCAAHFSRQECSLEDFSCSLPSSKMNLESSSTNIDPHLI